MLIPIYIAVAAIVVIAVVASMFKQIDQAHVGVVTMFGKYRRILDPGLNVLIPFFEQIHSRVPVQNQTAQLKFSAITADQAAVHFTATLIYTVSDHSAETVQLVAFKFLDPSSFETAMTSAVEAAVREFVATKHQAEVLGLRAEIVSHAKENLDEQLASWGYTLQDLTVNDIAFGKEIMASMEKVVTAKNRQAAAEYEGQALLIQRTKAAEAEGAAIQIAAKAEAEAARLRGEGLANFRRELSKGLSDSAELLKGDGVPTELLAFTMWTETMHEIARDGQGNVLFIDGGIPAMGESMKRLEGLLATRTPLAGDGAEGVQAQGRHEAEPAPTV